MKLRKAKNFSYYGKIFLNDSFLPLMEDMLWSLTKKKLRRWHETVFLPLHSEINQINKNDKDDDFRENKILPESYTLFILLQQLFLVIILTKREAFLVLRESKFS